MEHTVIRYNVKDGSAEENRGLVEKVFEALDRSTPEALQYLVLELEDGEFIHVVGKADEASPLPEMAAFKAFTEHHAERRSTPVVRKSARIIGNYRMMAGDQPH
jgi:hypothetical protein